MITKEGGLLVAGTGSKGQLGLGDDYNDDGYLSISRVPDVDSVVSVAAGQNHTVILREDGRVLAWGDNKYGQLGADPEAAASAFVPREVIVEETLVKVYAGWTHSAALAKNGEVKCLVFITYHIPWCCL